MKTTGHQNAPKMDSVKRSQAHIASMMRATMKATAYRYEARDLERLAANIAAWVEHGQRYAAVAGDPNFRDARDENRSMAKTYARDARDLQAIHDAVKEGDYAKAARLARRLDTVVRDQIPVRLYNAIHQG